MTVYEKLVQARLKFQSSNVKKSGKNTYAGYTYFELEDILPVCNKICDEVKAVCVVSFTDTLATLDFIDCEKPEDKVVFTSPMSKATLKGCHDVQNLGAVESYIKRYLYQNCFEISDVDPLDGTMNPNVPSSGRNTPPATPAGARGTPSKPKWSKEQMNEMGNILNSIYPSGAKVFTDGERDTYRRIMCEGGDFDLAITKAKKELQERMQGANTEFPEDLF